MTTCALRRFRFALLPALALLIVTSSASAQLEARLAKLDQEKAIREQLRVINDKLEIACEKLRAIVLSERLRRSPLPRSEDDKKKIEVAECCRLANVRAKVQPILASFRGEGPPAHL